MRYTYSAIKFAIVVSTAVLFGCNNGPKNIDSSTNKSKDDVLNNSEVFGPETQDAASEPDNNEEHTVVVKEILETQKYVYLSVSENDGSPYWIATLKQEVKVGESYSYSGGLLKTNFKSIEHNRVFEKLYLVSTITPAGHAGHNHTEAAVNDEPTNTNSSEKIIRNGSISIATIVANPGKYKDQTIQVSGKCVKVNSNIMDRNWIHLKDGSKDNYDFVVTCDKAIPVGHTVTFKGKLILNKDFGAGYKYDIILENGVLVN